ncbi:hypothetical protein KKC22_13470, partial [Myxococcota bacterium]|nr:hypothetical protein [Myxococcota bacterium]
MTGSGRQALQTAAPTVFYEHRTAKICCLIGTTDYYSWFAETTGDGMPEENPEESAHILPRLMIVDDDEL